MNNYKFPSLLTAVICFLYAGVFAQTVNYYDSWGGQGITLVSEEKSEMNVNYSLQSFQFDQVMVDGITMKAIHLPGVFLPNEAGAPDLPVNSRYIAIPQGAVARIDILSSRTEVMQGIDIAPAPVIPLDSDPNPQEFQKDPSIYSRNAFYPAEPVILSSPDKIRGIDVVMLAVCPFQYNPVTKELIVYRDLQFKITLEGGSGQIGDDRLRSPWWDPIVKGAVLNPEAIPEMAYETVPSSNRTPDYEYIIITPDLPAFTQWADSIKVWRTLQGIRTGVVTTTEIGGNTVSAIENYINTAYNTWAVPPVAVLMLGDYSAGTDGITSNFYTHPAGYPDFASDNYFADVDGNELPDIIFARITARNATELQVMVGKFLSYERNPPADPDFYDKPVTALGWQTVRWFQICSEVIGGYLRNVQGKHPVRINAVYAGDPTIDPWSSAYNTSSVLNYFGPNGQGYIPATPQELGGFSGGTGAQIQSAINTGTFMVMHRDHGAYTAWGEPYFTTSSIAALTNTNNELPFVFSINCQTGAYQGSSECIAEKFHRKTYNGQNSGALGVIAPTEVSYSFVNDTYMWGVFDNMFPGFMPTYSTQFPTSFVLPAFGNAAGKYFLYQSSWPFNSGDKLVTYRLFHTHGDAFSQLYTEVPQALSVSHAATMASGETSFIVTANAGSSIALTVNGLILATATGTGTPLAITIPAIAGGQVMKVTVTKQNYYRYASNVEVTSGGVIANFSASQTSIFAGQSISFTDLSFGSPNSWTWSFPGGTPATYSGQVPPSILYSTAGTYDVTLTVSNGSSSDVETKTGLIVVSTLEADFVGTPISITTGQTVTFTDLSSSSATSWAWSFPGGQPSSHNGKVPPAILYNTPGHHSVSLTVSNGNATDTQVLPEYINVNTPQYCTSQGNAAQEWITSFTLNGQTNSSGSSGTAGYQDFTAVSFPLNSGITYVATVVPGFNGTTFNEYMKIWIDFNDDMDFDDTGEEVFSAAKKKTATSGNITIPSGLNVTTRMRISMKRNAFATTCEAFGAGEVEDYTVVITPQAPQPPVANFSGTPLSVVVGGSVSFTDLSTNNPTSWSWSFPGGTPSSSMQQNPAVVYSTAGTYNVTLVATNGVGPDTETKTGYITVTSNPPAPTYCEPVAINNNADYINTVTLGAATSNTGKGSSGYLMYTTPEFAFTPGQSYSVSLSPYNQTNRNFWKIWIDLNGDGDFIDSDETFFTSNNKKGTATGTMAIPGYATGTTRMRISMKTGGSQAPCDDNFSGEVEDYTVNFGGEALSILPANDALVLQVFPNPAKNYFNINVSGNAGPVKITVYSAQGKMIKALELEDTSARIDMNGRQPGMYFIHVTDGNRNKVSKIILE